MQSLAERYRSNVATVVVDGDCNNSSSRRWQQCESAVSAACGSWTRRCAASAHRIITRMMLRHSYTMNAIPYIRTPTPSINAAFYHLRFIDCSLFFSLGLLTCTYIQYKSCTCVIQRLRCNALHCSASNTLTRSCDDSHSLFTAAHRCRRVYCSYIIYSLHTWQYSADIASISA